MENTYRQLEKLLFEFQTKVKEELLKAGVEAELGEVEFKLKKIQSAVGVMDTDNGGVVTFARCKKNVQGQIVCS